jgi:hypothetical protein
MLSGSTVLTDIVRKIEPEHFFNPIHRELYKNLLEMRKAELPIDLLTFSQWLRDRNLMAKLGGDHYITALSVDVLIPEYFYFHVDVLRRKYFDRQMLGLAKMARGKAFGADNEEAGAIVGELTKSLDRLRETAAKTGKIDLCDAVLYLNGNCPPMPAEIVYGLLHQGSKMVVGGTSKGRKTMALIDLAVSVATGSKWWGYSTKRGPVCYINFEIQEPFFWYRVNQVLERKGVDIPPGMLYAWNLRGRGEGIENLREEILGVLKQKPFVLNIIDPIYKALGDRDENRAGDVASMLNEIEKIAVETGAAVAFGAHYSKGNQALKESIDRIGGSGVFARDPDTILTMTAHEEDECFTVEGTLRNFPPMRPFVVKWDWPLFIRHDADPNMLKQARANPGQFKAKFHKEMLLDHLSVAQGMSAVDLRKIVDKRHGMSKSTFYNLKAELVEKRLAIERDGELWRATRADQSPTDSSGESPALESPLETQPF